MISCGPSRSTMRPLSISSRGLNLPAANRIHISHEPGPAMLRARLASNFGEAG